MSSRGRSTKPRRFAGAADSDDDASEGTNKRRKHHNPWSVPAPSAFQAHVTHHFDSHTIHQLINYSDLPSI